MRRLFGVLVVLAVAACTGEKPGANPPAADTAGAAPTDSALVAPPAALPPRGDSVMARDTAHQM
jgi:hypothetical protein